MNRRLFVVVSLLLVVVMAVSGCAKPSPTPTQAPPTSAPPTATAVPPTATAVPPTPTPAPRKGAWADKLVFTVQKQADVAVSQLKSKDIDVYAFSVSDPELFKKVKNDPDLKYAEGYGAYTELTFNPVGPEYGKGELNPFSDPKIREAVNWLVDRNHIVQEIYGGLAVPKYLPITSAFPDYARYIDTVRALELKYAYNPDKAKAVITEEMKKMGAKLVDGKWMYKGKPVTIKFIIRTEDERKEIGDYVANQFESLGFTVDRMYKNMKDAGALWIRTNPKEGKWTVYTGGWITTAIDRDQGGNFSFFYTPRGIPVPLWQAYKPSKEFDEVAKKLENNDFTSMEERGKLFRKALELALKDSVRVWIADQKSFSPYRKDIDVTSDLAGGIAGAQLYPFTIRRTEGPGGTIKIAQPSILNDPWNPIAGSDSVYDTMPQRATGDWGVISDPFTGLKMPQRIAKAELDVKKGLPVAKTMNWVNLKFVDKITVPDDAWVDWDAKAGKFITAGEMKVRIQKAKAKVKEAKDKATELAAKTNAKALTGDALVKYLTDLTTAYGLKVDVAAQFKGDKGQKKLAGDVKSITGADDPAKALADYGVQFLQNQDPDTFDIANRDYSTANTKSVVYYPKGMFQKVTWHDGSKLSVADFVMDMILTFDRGKKDSPYYDPSAAPNLESLLSHFKGVRIVSTDPLVIETYDNQYALDAENSVTTWWPYYSYGEAPWHTIAVALMAEGNKELALSQDKADNLKVEWTNFISGPSLKVLKKYLDEATKENFIPYKNVLGKYITPDEAKARYANLNKFYAKYGHFWIGTGPYMLKAAHPVEKSIELARFDGYPDPANKWLKFSEPKIATVSVDGPGRVKNGEEATFNVTVTFKGKPYPAKELSEVKYLVFDVNGNVVATGDAKLVKDGQYKVVLGKDVTSKLEAGTNRIEIAVSPLVVSVPSFADMQFVSVP